MPEENPYMEMPFEARMPLFKDPYGKCRLILPDLILRIEKMLKAANLVYRATRYRQMEPWA